MTRLPIIQSALERLQAALGDEFQPVEADSQAEAELAPESQPEASDEELLELYECRHQRILESIGELAGDDQDPPDGI